MPVRLCSKKERGGVNDEVEVADGSNDNKPFTDN